MRIVSMVVPVLMNPTFAWAFMTRAFKTITTRMKYVAIGRNNVGINVWMVANPLMLVAKIFAPIHSKLILLAVLAMKNAWTAVHARVTINAALSSLPPQQLLPAPLAPPRALHLPLRQPPHQPAPLPQLQAAILRRPQQNRFRLHRVRTVIIRYRISISWFSIRRTLKKLNSLGILMDKKVWKKPMSFRILIITQNELTCVRSLCRIEDISSVEKAANTTTVRVFSPYRKSTGNVRNFQSFEDIRKKIVRTFIKWPND